MEIRNELGSKRIDEVRHILVETPTTVKANDDMRTLMEKINEDLRTRHVYVVDDDGKLIGSVRMNMIVKYLFPYSSKITSGITLGPDKIFNFFANEVGDIMKRDPFHVSDDVTLEECGKIMIEEGINELPVVDDEKRLIGQINVYEIIEAYKSYVAKTDR